MRIRFEPRLTALAAALGLAFAGEAAAQVCVDTPARLCTVTSNQDNAFAAPVVAGSLRDAINYINNACGCSGPYAVRFAFPGLTTITLQQPLFVAGFGCGAQISGYDATAGLPATPNTIAGIRGGSNANPLVVIDATAVSVENAALTLQAANSGVKGLVFQNYGDGTAAISIQGPNISVVGNHIGTNAAGTACAGANGIGIEVFGSPFAIGGPNPGDRNIIGCSSTGNAGIYINAFQGDISNNFIGTGAGGQALPNDVGILAEGFSPFDVNVGFPSTGLGNLIARNSRAGVVVAGFNASGVYVQGNDIFLNGTLGIDLDNSATFPPVGDGPNPVNPSLFAGSGGPNSNINRPQIDFVRYDAANTTIDWSYSGFANSQVFLDFAANPPGLGIDEGARWFGTASAFTSGAGAASGSTTFAGIQPSPTATASMVNSGALSNVGTSEFSAPPALEVSPRFLNFGSVPAGSSSAPQVVTFQNLGSTPILVGPPLTTGDYAATSTCDGTTPVPVGGSCTANVTFNPLFLGLSSGGLDMPTSGTGGGRGIALDGNGVAIPVISPSVAGPVNFGSVRVGTASTPVTITFSNTGTGDLTISSVALAGAAVTSFNILTNGCAGATLNTSNPTCTVSVGMTPQAGGALVADLVVASNDPATPSLAIGLTGTGLAPVLAANPAGPINFGTVQTGLASVPVSVSFSNSGNGSLQVTGATLTGAAASSFQVLANGCTGQTLTASPPTTCAIDVAMQPQAVGALAATLSVTSDATNPNLAVALAGTGSAAPVVAPVINASPAGPVDFGSRRIGTQSAPVAFTVAPASGGSVTISSVGPRGTGFAVVSDTCTGATLALGTTVPSCTFSVLFAPAFEGPYRTSIQVLSNANNPQLLVEVTGTGTPLPVGRLSATPGTVSFGTQALGITTNPQTVLVTNSGTLPVAVGGVRATGDFAQTNDCRSLDAGASCRAFVTFTPTGQGDRLGNLIVDSDATNAQLVVSLQGTGSPAPVPLVELNPGAVTFGNSLMGSSGGGTPITLRNAGGASLEIARIYATGDFRVTHNCPASLPPGASCLVTVTFSPSIAGARTGKLVVESNAADGAKEASLSGTGCRNFGLGSARLGASACK